MLANQVISYKVPDMEEATKSTLIRQLKESEIGPAVETLAWIISRLPEAEHLTYQEIEERFLFLARDDETMLILLVLLVPFHDMSSEIQQEIKDSSVKIA